MKREFPLPTLGKHLRTGEIIATGEVVSVLVREGDVIAAGDGVIEIETEKAVVEITCPHAGKVVKINMVKGQTVQAGQSVLAVETSESAPAAKSRPASASTEVKRLAEELGVGLAGVQGTGRGGRVTADDVRRAAQEAAVEEETSQGVTPQHGSREPAVPPGALGEDAYGHVRRERMSAARLAVAASAQSAAAVPQSTHFDDADVTDLERMRKTVPATYLGPTVKLSSLAFVLKAVAAALRQHPTLNAALDAEKNEIIYKQYVHLGVTVETPRGLFTPVLRNVDQMGILQIARELTMLAARSRSADFTAEELSGGGFTISSLGSAGGVYSTPMVRPPEAAHLLLGRTRWLIGVAEGKVEGRLMLPLSLSFDARVVDGPSAGRFLGDVIDYLQSPGKLMLVK